MRLFCRLEKKGGEAARAFLSLAFPRAYRFLPLSVLWRPSEQARPLSNLNQVRPRRLSLGSAADRVFARPSSRDGLRGSFGLTVHVAGIVPESDHWT